MMQALFGFGYGATQAGPGFALSKVTELAPAIALTTASWLVIVVLVSYVAGFHTSVSLLLGIALVVAVISGGGLALLLARRADDGLV
jgi:hypothetical protein